MQFLKDGVQTVGCTDKTDGPLTLIVATFE